jgi:triphosphoribosyl-dephospho-CoA synthase
MSFPLPAAMIAEAFVAACQAELEALKPGNVHVRAPGHDMNVRHFELAAAAAAPHIAQKGLRVGRRIREAVEASYAAAGCNANLGIVLLCAPLAYAAGEIARGETLSRRLADVLKGLDRLDAEEAFAAIAHAQPAGLGQVEKGDVNKTAEITLREAMALAAARDRIALAYVTDFADIFEFAVPLLRQIRRVARKPELAVTTLHMHLLARFTDSHIARKYGVAVAEEVRAEAEKLLPLCQPATTESSLPELLRFDTALKERGLNPGTTADFVVACLFTEGLTCQVADANCF